MFHTDITMQEPMRSNHRAPGDATGCNGNTRRLKAYHDGFKDLKGNAQVCTTTVGLSQTLLLADPNAMDHILEAICKLKAHSAELAKAA